MRNAHVHDGFDHGESLPSSGDLPTHPDTLKANLTADTLHMAFPRLMGTALKTSIFSYRPLE
jgi:hypothetical protein